MARHVSAGSAPGMVIGLARGGEASVTAIGSSAVESDEALSPDALFRITSMTKPVAALGALLLVEEGVLALDEPVDVLLPELAERQVLRRLQGPIDQTVAARRPITLRDLLTFRAGFGVILAPVEEYPILEAERSLELMALGPPTPVTPHEPDEWIRRLGTLPLMEQPGEQWRYHTAAQILGVLIARAARRPVESFFRERIFEPLGMRDTHFRAPAAKRERLVPCYWTLDGELQPFDDDDQWTRPRPFPDCGAGLISTVADYLVFARMLLAGGRHAGEAFLDPALVAMMTSDQLSAEQRAGAGVLLDGRGWGFGLSIIDPPPSGRGPGGYGWSGGFGTVWMNDPREELVAMLFTQVLASPGSSGLEEDFWSATYRALA